LSKIRIIERTKEDKNGKKVDDSGKDTAIPKGF